MLKMLFAIAIVKTTCIAAIVPDLILVADMVNKLIDGEGWIINYWIGEICFVQAYAISKVI